MTNYRKLYKSVQHRTTQNIQVTGSTVNIAFAPRAEYGNQSAAAARLAEELIAAHIGCERSRVRVANMMPSGRPHATVRGRSGAIHVSMSHSSNMIGACVCETTSVGLDIVQAEEVDRKLDFWFTPNELSLLPEEDTLLRARIWGAKEAAFKAARLDEGFRPCAVKITALESTSFRWSVQGNHRKAAGQGIFTLAGMHLCALAVAAATQVEEHPARLVTTTLREGP